MSNPQPDQTVIRDSGPNLAPMRELLDRLGYSEPAILDRLGLHELPAYHRRMQALPKHLWQTRAGTPLDLLVRLFLLRQSVPTRAIAEVLAPIPLEQWAEAGLLQVGEVEVTATFELIPLGGLLVAADWPGASHAQEEPVMGVAASTRALAQLTIRRSVEHVLDLGTGCGILAMLAAGHAERVWAVDLNPRSVVVARWNAEFNGLSNIECLQGNLFDPVRDKSFDLILCNPPFVIAPAQTWMHTHGGRPVDQLCQDITREAPAFLREGGFCQILCNWAHLAGQDWCERLQTWLADTGCDAWVMRFHTEDAPAYALNRIGELTDDPDQSARQFHDWMAYYQQQRIEAISFGTITMRRRSDGPNWFRCDSPSRPADLTGQAIQQQFALWDFLHAHTDDNKLLACRLRAADNLRWDVQHDLTPGGWHAVESRLSRKDGLAQGGNVDMEVVEFVAFCDGKKSLRDYLRQVSLRTGQEVSRLAPPFLQVVRRLVEMGYLVPAEWEGDRPR